MLAARLRNVFFTLLATEVLCSNVVFAFWSYMIYRHPDFFGDDFARPTILLAATFLFTLLVFLVAFYHNMIRFTRFDHAIIRRTFVSVQAGMAGVCLFFVLLSVVVADAKRTLAIAGFSIMAMAFVAIGHLTASYALKKVYSMKSHARRILLIGYNYRTRDFCRVLQSIPHLGAQVLGYLDDEKDNSKGSRPNTKILGYLDEVEKGADRKNVTGKMLETAGKTTFHYLGSPSELGNILRREVVDAVFIFLPVRSFYDTIQQIVEISTFYGVSSSIVGNIFGKGKDKWEHLSISDFGGVGVAAERTDYLALAAKRILDIAVAAGSLVVLSPVLLAIALFIKLTSKGPVFFTQDRIGLNKRTFKMFKFRTMIPNAEEKLKELEHLNEMDGPAFKIANDPRLIRGASFLRRHSLDELPQIWNVLRGDMSIVGPRPLSQRDYDKMEEDWQRKRFSIRPGLTCLWQAGGRNNLTFREWMLLDLEYIDRWSLGLDLKIICKTFEIVIRGSGR